MGLKPSRWSGEEIVMYINGIDNPRNVPTFFREVWTESDGNPIQSYEKWKERTKSHERWGHASLVLILIEIFGFIGFALMTPKGSITNLPLFSSAATLNGALIIYCIAKWILSNPKREFYWSHTSYFDKLSRLYSAFDITPSRSVGNLSREEFRAQIEEMLRHKGVELDAAPGFKKTPLREQLRVMHNEAIEWQLCHKNWKHYFPEKEEAK
jgi:hypothetical protein